ncbi:MAG: AAA family ATPase, partial [Woeseiaceae bacterium]|nr:AAA family ATPase [Woeseiaceae bacterium]
MYAQHFGLKKRPFRKNASGSDVFVGPQIATIMAGLKKALAGSDSIVTVSGPVGTGKTTLVNRALESISDSRKIVHLARMRLDSKDVLEFLLDELGVQGRPSGIIQQFGLFRRCLRELDASNVRVFIAVEDATHLGAETLAELEALTAADAGESDGASIVLMGDENLGDMLVGPQLVRLQQRIRHRYKVAPLCPAELRGYLRHCFRLAGGDFERLFEVNAAPLLHHLCGGVLRINNNLVDSVLATASDQDLSQV